MNQHVELPTMSLDLTSVDLDDMIKGASLKDLFEDVHAPEHPDRFGHYMYVNSGIFFPLDPRPEEVKIEDIAIALSRIPRFGGNSKKFLSVAEHSWICSQIVEPEVQLEALLHDAAEAYIGDMIRPLKNLPLLGTIYLKIEANLEQVIAQRFGLVHPWPKNVKWADEVVVGAEVYQNIASPKENYLTDDSIARESGVNTQLRYWSAETAQHFFLKRFYQLIETRRIG